MTGVLARRIVTTAQARSMTPAGTRPTKPWKGNAMTKRVNPRRDPFALLTRPTKPRDPDEARRALKRKQALERAARADAAVAPPPSTTAVSATVMPCSANAATSPGTSVFAASRPT